MTSLSNEHDNIDVICASSDVNNDVEASLVNKDDDATTTLQTKLKVDDAGRNQRNGLLTPTGGAPRAVGSDVLTDKAKARQKRIKIAVIAATLLLITFSMILVGVTLSMSGHIDEMVRQKNDNVVSTTVAPFVNSTRHSTL